MKGVTPNYLFAKRLMDPDVCLSECQRECTSRLGITIQLEQEAYVTKHPEVKAMLEIFVKKMILLSKKRDILKEAGEYFTKTIEELEKDIRERLGVSKTEQFEEGMLSFKFKDPELINDLKNIIMKEYPIESRTMPAPYRSTSNTPSSSFLSIVTSDTTIPTPEPIPPPEPTVFETFYGFISEAVDIAIYIKVDDRALHIDTAYVELVQCVEQAMEIPVIGIREDIAELFHNAYELFEKNILEKEKIAAEIAWEKRMRKKLKKTIRCFQNFKGYETPPTPKSEISSHESYKKPIPHPCICHPQFNYNRYPKDRFGIYLPLKTKYRKVNVTTTPAISEESLVDKFMDKQAEKPIGKKSTASKNSYVSKEIATFEE